MTEAQFEKLFKLHFAELCNVAYAVVKDNDQARDIVQQVFIKFWDKRTSVDIDDNIKSYLKRAVINTAINHLDRIKKLKFEDDFQSFNISDDSDSIQKEQRIAEVNSVIKASVMNLPEKCQVVFSLSRYEGMTNQEVADYLDISIKAVEKHISRALKELREKLQPYLRFIAIILFIGVGLLSINLF